MKNIDLTIQDIQSIKDVVSFSKAFSIDVLKITPSGAIGLDDTPSLAIFVNPTTPYSGPELFLNRLKTLDLRLDIKSKVRVVYNDGGVPVNMEIVSGKKTIDFRLASIQKRLPGAFTGSFAHTLQLPKSEIAEIIAGCRAIGGSTVSIEHRNGRQVAVSSNEGEKFQFVINESTRSDAQYQFNYSIDHLSTVEKMLPIDATFVGNITPKGQMLVDISTTTVSAQIFILDIKNR